MRTTTLTKGMIFCLALATANSAMAGVKCFSELQALESSLQVQNEVTDNILSDDSGNIEYIGRWASTMLNSPDAVIGDSGNGVQDSYIKDKADLSDLKTNLQNAKDDVSTKTKALETCLVN